MLIEERHQKILEILNRTGQIKSREIMEMFDIGFDSARRDLRILEEKGKLIRTHGGAIPLLQVGYRMPKHNTPKDITDIKANYMSIAKKAVEMISKNDVVYITGASVGYFMVKMLPKDFEFTVITNSIILSDELRMYDNVTTYLLGGLLTPKGKLKDHFTIQMIERMRFDKVFLTSAAFSVEFGMSIQESINVEILQALMKNTRQTIGMFPHEKMGRNSIIKICDVDALDILITDWETCEKEVERVREENIDVIVVEEMEK